jgi:hypothetical protein
MEQSRVDRPLTVERLTEADLIAAVRAAATIIAIRYAPPSGPIPLSLTVRWYCSAEDDHWSIVVEWDRRPFDFDAADAEAGRLLQPILQAMRPRAVRHIFRSPADEATTEDWGTIGNAGVMPTADFFEPRWVEDRTVVQVGTGPAGPGLVEDPEAVLADISARLSP